MSTPAQEEFDRLVASNTPVTPFTLKIATTTTTSPKPAQKIYLKKNCFETRRLKQPCGVIADARSYQSARKSKWADRAKTVRRSIFGAPGTQNGGGSRSESETDEEAFSGNEGSDEEEFLQEWRETRRRELEGEANRAVRTRRTSPSVRVYGRMDEVDALGYLDAIEKVGRETTVVVFVYDHECEVSATIDSAIYPLVRKYPAVHFVKVHYEEIEFDNAAVPAILAYRNQGDLVANLTGIIEMMPDDDSFGPDGLESIFKAHRVL
ncbi:Phosducin-like-like protein [Cladobotryum mycophilum]|uniref:Phosducin-like-like protein n=1 Tax=Cladobotryum mycophilum TaxID=491253 RepID=A0ABR0SQT8_9HYPO